MSRLDGLDENTLVATLTGLRSDMDQLKERQSTSMASGLLGYQTILNDINTPDDDRVVGTNSDTANHGVVYTLTFNGDGSQVVTFANLAFSLSANGNPLTVPFITWTDGTRTAVFNTSSPTISRNTYTLTITVITFKAVHLQLKMYANGSQRGSLTIGVAIS